MKLITSFIKLQVLTCLVVTMALLIMVPSITHAGTRMGISGTMGGGIFVASDADFYGGIPVDLYPELGLQIDISMIRLGLKFAYIYRKTTLDYSISFYDPFSGYQSYEESYEYTVSYLPIQAEFLLAPFSGTGITPYAGLMLGIFLATGDNTESTLAISPKFGMEVDLEPLILYGDVRYTYAPLTSEVYLGDYRNLEQPQVGRFDVDVGGIMIVLGIGIRIGS